MQKNNHINTMKKSTFCEAMFAKSTHSLTKLRMQRGCIGLGIYMCLLEALFDESTGMLPKEYDVIAFRFGLAEDEVRDVVENFGLFEFTDDGMFYCERLRAERKPKPKKETEKTTPQQPEPESVVAEVIENDSYEHAIMILRNDTEWQKHTSAIFNINDPTELMKYLDEYLCIREEEGLVTRDMTDLKNSFTMWLNSRLSLTY